MSAGLAVSGIAARRQRSWTRARTSRFAASIDPRGYARRAAVPFEAYGARPKTRFKKEIPLSISARKRRSRWYTRAPPTTSRTANQRFLASQALVTPRALSGARMACEANPQSMLTRRDCPAEWYGQGYSRASGQEDDLVPLAGGTPILDQHSGAGFE